jgi:cytochrome P450
MSIFEQEQQQRFAWYKAMRADASGKAQYGSRNVFRYDDVQQVLSDHATFSSQWGGGASNDVGRAIEASLISIDPPRHRQLRALVSQAFTPRTIAQLQPRITAIVHELLDHVEAQGKMDLIEDLAYPLPVIVIAELLGIPTEDRADFKRWSDAVVTGRHAPGTNPQREMGMYFVRMIEQRRREPRNDLISALLAAQIDGQHLTQQELLGFCSLLLVAGNETTTNLIGNAILCFDQQPEIFERLHAEPTLLPTAIEEVLRYRSPVQSMFRIAAKDATVGGNTIRRGQTVIAWIGSANHDEQHFDAPEQFNIERSPNRHLAFGHGIHFCLGAPLARLEARIALDAIIQRLPGLRRVPDIALELMPSTIVYGVKQLPVRWE